MKAKKITFTLIAAASIGLALPIIASAETVYYNGVGLYWNHGRTNLGLSSFSDVQSGVLQHSSTANETFSGWQQPGTLAHAEQLIGFGTAYAFWNAR